MKSSGVSNEGISFLKKIITPYGQQTLTTSPSFVNLSNCTSFSIGKLGPKVISSISISAWTRKLSQKNILGHTTKLGFFTLSIRFRIFSSKNSMNPSDFWRFQNSLRILKDFTKEIHYRQSIAVTQWGLASTSLQVSFEDILDQKSIWNCSSLLWNLSVLLSWKFIEIYISTFCLVIEAAFCSK